MVVLVVALAAVGYVLAKAFSSQIGVDVASGGRLLFSMVLCGGMILLALWSQLTDGFFGLRALMPPALCTLWAGLWPSMKVWGAKPLYLEGMPLDNADLQWWATTYSQWGGWFLLLFGGYAIAYWTWTRN